MSYNPIVYPGLQGVYVSSSYVASSATLILAKAEGGAFSVFMPMEPSVGQYFTVKKMDASSNAVTVDGKGPKIDGAPTQLLIGQFDGMTVVWTGIEWVIAAIF